jgi:hypothetical protein
VAEPLTTKPINRYKYSDRFLPSYAPVTLSAHLKRIDPDLTLYPPELTDMALWVQKKQDFNLTNFDKFKEIKDLAPDSEEENVVEEEEVEDEEENDYGVDCNTLFIIDYDDENDMIGEDNDD